jgi:hypothetical protein
MSHKETVDLLIKHYTWKCPACGNIQSEYGVPAAPDLTCQFCSANYNRGKLVHTYQTKKPAPYVSHLHRQPDSICRYCHMDITNHGPTCKYNRLTL